MAKIEPGHFVFISIPMGDAKFVTKEGRRAGQPPILSRISKLDWRDGGGEEGEKGRRRGEEGEESYFVMV